jgi:hypothetical protein
MEKNGIDESNTPLRWSVYSDGLRVWKDGKHLGTIPSKDLLHVSHEALRLLRRVYGSGAEKKPD